MDKIIKCYLISVFLWQAFLSLNLTLTVNENTIIAIPTPKNPQCRDFVDVKI